MTILDLALLGYQQRVIWGVAATWNNRHWLDGYKYQGHTHNLNCA